MATQESLNSTVSCGLCWSFIARNCQYVGCVRLRLFTLVSMQVVLVFDCLQVLACGLCWTSIARSCFACSCYLTIVSMWIVLVFDCLQPLAFGWLYLSSGDVRKQVVLYATVGNSHCIYVFYAFPQLSLRSSNTR